MSIRESVFQTIDLRPLCFELKVDLQIQWLTIFEKTFIITTPSIIIAMPNIAGISGICLNSMAPVTVISVIPTPDQIAYAIPTGTVFSTSDKKYTLKSTKLSFEY